MTLHLFKSTIILSKSLFQSKLIKPTLLFQVTPTTVCSRVFNFNHADDRMKCQSQQCCWYCCYGSTPLPWSMLEDRKTDGQPHPYSTFVLSCVDYVAWCELSFCNDCVINKSSSPNANWWPQLKWSRNVWYTQHEGKAFNLPMKITIKLLHRESHAIHVDGTLYNGT